MKSTLSTDQINQSIQAAKVSRLNSLVFMLFIAVGVNVFFSIATLVFVNGMAHQKRPTLVQMENGETIKIGYEDPNYRKPEVIRRYVSDVLTYLMTMTSYGPHSTVASSLDETRKLAEPVKISTSGGKSGQITQSSWLATEMLEPNFGKAFREQLAGLPTRDVFSGREEIILKIDYVKDPVEVTDRNGKWLGRWQVDVVANLKVYRKGAGEVKIIPFNKRVILRPIDAPLVTDIEGFGDLASSINRISQSGLQIISITDLKTSGVFQ